MATNAPLQDLDFSDFLEEGYLNKKGVVGRSWKRRYFKFNDITLEYYKGKECAKLLGSIDVQGCRVVSFMHNLQKRDGFVFGITPAGGERTYMIEAQSEEERQCWMKAISRRLGVDGGTVESLSEEKACIATLEVDARPLKQGVLNKLGARGFNKTSRWFTLYKRHLTYWKSKAMTKRLGNIPVTSQMRVEELTTIDHAFTIQSNASAREYTLIAKNDKERRKWIWAVQLLIDEATKQVKQNIPVEMLHDVTPPSSDADSDAEESQFDALSDVRGEDVVTVVKQHLSAALFACGGELSMLRGHVEEFYKEQERASQ